MLFFLLPAFLMLSLSGLAHTINYALEEAPRGQVFWYYFKLGFQHILPFGVDHILFIVALCLPGNTGKAIFWQATAFTIAHSITLVLSMKNIVMVPAALVEPIIALSILFVAIENIFFSRLKPWRVGIVFLFGLIHGMGFASSLNEIGLPRNRFFTSIFSFNVGVELGQLTIIASMLAFILLPLQRQAMLKQKQWVTYSLSLLIGLVAVYWTVERVFFL
jgi:hypothetical protein